VRWNFAHKATFRAWIGAAGFEPTTTCTPYRCATKLRYAPMNLPATDCNVEPDGCATRLRSDEPTSVDFNDEPDGCATRLRCGPMS
jgi:hypothetical protein